MLSMSRAHPTSVVTARRSSAVVCSLFAAVAWRQIGDVLQDPAMETREDPQRISRDWGSGPASAALLCTLGLRLSAGSPSMSLAFISTSKAMEAVTVWVDDMAPNPSLEIH